MLLLSTALLWTFLSLFVCAQRLLVVHDPDISLPQYSSLWDALSQRGINVTYRTSSKATDDAQLFSYSEPQFDQLLFLAPQAKALSSDLSPQSLYSFITTPRRSESSLPRNIFFGLAPDMTEKWRSFAREFSLEFAESKSTAMDFFASHQGDYKQIALPSGAVHPLAKPGNNNNNNNAKPLVYSGIAHTSTRGHPSVVNFLHGLPTTFSNVPDKESSEQSPSGSNAQLVTGFQTSDGARILWSGSHEIFNNRFWNDRSLDNGEFASKIMDWLFTGDKVVNVVNVQHERIGGLKPKGEYRRADYMKYSVSLTTVSGKAPTLPLQLEVTMLDPYLRVPLALSSQESNTSTAVYSTTVQLPDKHGVFTLLVDHRDPQSGYTPLQVRQTISITPLRHDEHPRFLVGAWPYYVGAVSSVGAWLVFVCIWLTGSRSQDIGKGKKKE